MIQRNRGLPVFLCSLLTYSPVYIMHYFWFGMFVRKDLLPFPASPINIKRGHRSRVPKTAEWNKGGQGCCARLCSSGARGRPASRCKRILTSWTCWTNSSLLEQYRSLRPLLSAAKAASRRPIVQQSDQCGKEEGSIIVCFKCITIIKTFARSTCLLSLAWRKCHKRKWTLTTYQNTLLLSQGILILSKV